MQRDGWCSFGILLEAVCLKGSEVDFHEEVCVPGSTKLFAGPLGFPGSDVEPGCSWASSCVSCSHSPAADDMGMIFPLNCLKELGEGGVCGNQAKAKLGCQICKPPFGDYEVPCDAVVPQELSSKAVAGGMAQLSAWNTTIAGGAQTFP